MTDPAVVSYTAKNGTEFHYEVGFCGFFYFKSPVSNAEHVLPAEDMHEFIHQYIACCFSPNQAATIVGVSAQWVTHLARIGELQGFQSPLGWLIDPDDALRLGIQREKEAK